MKELIDRDCGLQIRKEPVTGSDITLLDLIPLSTDAYSKSKHDSQARENGVLGEQEQRLRNNAALE